MLAVKSFFGKRLDMEHYKNVLTERTIEVLDEDDDEYDLGDSDVYYELFAKPHGKSLQVENLGDQTDNMIVLDDLIFDYRPGYYYHECYQLTDASPGEKILLFYGVSEII